MRWKLHANRTNEPPSYRRTTPLPAGGGEQERDHVAKDTSAIGPASAYLPPHCQLMGELSICYVHPSADSAVGANMLVGPVVFLAFAT